MTECNWNIFDSNLTPSSQAMGIRSTSFHTQCVWYDADLVSLACEYDSELNELTSQTDMQSVWNYTIISSEE